MEEQATQEDISTGRQSVTFKEQTATNHGVPENRRQSVARRQSMGRRNSNFAIKQEIALVEREAPHRKGVWAVVAGCVLALQAYAFAPGISRASECSIGKEWGPKQELYGNKRYGEAGALRQIILPWVAAFCLGFHFDHRGR